MKGFKWTQTNELMLRKILILLLSLVGIITAGADGAAQSYRIDSLNQKTFYVCPPCGCSLDQQLFSAPGRCPHCQMPLLKVEAGTKQKIRNEVAFIFQYARQYADHYVRLVYPLILFGGLMALLLLLTRPNLKSIFLVLFMLSFVLYMLKFQLYGTNYSINISRRALFFPISFLALSWPALFFFIQSSLKKERLKFARVGLHFLPALILWLLQLYCFISHPASERYLFNRFDSYLNPLEQFIFVLGAILYGIMIYRSIWKNRKSINDKEKSWVIKLLIFPVLISCTLLILLVLNAFLYDLMVSTLDYHILWLIMTLSIPWFSYLIFLKREELLSWKEPSKNRVSGEKIDLLVHKVKTIMEEQKPFLDPDFNLLEFARLTEVSVKEMSEILKRGFNSNFYQFVNTYRVNETKRMLIDPKFNHLTNFAIAQMAGFRSKSTFISYFKKIEGKTPKVYKLEYNANRQ